MSSVAALLLAVVIGSDTLAAPDPQDRGAKRDAPVQEMWELPEGPGYSPKQRTGRWRLTDTKRGMGPAASDQPPGRGPGRGGGEGDPDGDGLTTQAELTGWDIVIDDKGYGLSSLGAFLTEKHVTSDPNKKDTDGDGLWDGLERQLLSDPRSADTDGDGINDGEEYLKWESLLNSVDSDGDARGPDFNQVPQPLLFDKNELDLVGTSPTLDDTDGDGRDDYTEIVELEVSPLLAELPLAVVDVVGDLDIRLNVEYAEAVGKSHEYGDTLTDIESATTGKNTEDTSSNAVSESITKSISHEGELEFFPPSFAGKTTVGVEGTVGGEHSKGQNVTTLNEKVKGFEKAHSDYITDSTEMTETSSSGSMSVGVRVRNDSVFTFTLKNLSLAVIKWVYDGDPDAEAIAGFKVMGTLVPTIETVTLSPGETTSVIQVSSDDFNPDVIEDFLVNPSSLKFQPTHFDLVDQEGIDFDFISQNALLRTALISIDYGDGVTEHYRVATNVDRDPLGAFVGINIKDALTTIIGLPEGDGENGYETKKQLDSEGVWTGNVVLTCVKGKEFNVGEPEPVFPLAYWQVLDTNESADLDVFDEIQLEQEDFVLLSYVQDADQDGLPVYVEDFMGTSDDGSGVDDPNDSDGDSRLDIEELVEGWLVELDPGEVTAVPGYPKQVYSSPFQADADLDGWDDAKEFDEGTDPNNPDTDGDGLIDGVDAYPKLPATILHCVPGVFGEGGSGLSWADPTDLVDCIYLYTLGQVNPGSNPDYKHVSAIWVKQGAHQTQSGSLPGNPPVELELKPRPGMRIFGGFAGFETKIGQRNPNPLTNGTFIGDFTGAVGDRVFDIRNGADGVVLDGFTIVGGRELAEGGDGAGILIRDSNDIVLRNLLVVDNQAEDAGGGLYVLDSYDVLIESCTFQGNRAGFGGGLASNGSADSLIVRDTQFLANTGYSYGGGAALLKGKKASFEGCVFAGNVVPDGGAEFNTYRRGGGLYVRNDRTETFISNCDFAGNTAEVSGGGLFFGKDSPESHAAMVNCRVYGNRSKHWGGAGISVEGPISLDGDVAFSPLTHSFKLINSTVVGNDAWFELESNPIGPPWWFDGMGCGLTIRDNSKVPGDYDVDVLNSIIRSNGGGWDQPDAEFLLCTDWPYDNFTFSRDLFYRRRKPGTDIDGDCGDKDGPQLIAPGYFTVAGCDLDYTPNTDPPPNVGLYAPWGLGGALAYGNIDVEPLFLNEAAGDLRLGGTSACIDAGIGFVSDTNPVAEGYQGLPPLDLAGQARQVDGTGDGAVLPDMGAYEHQGGP
jgi:hypothetical protein